MTDTIPPGVFIVHDLELTMDGCRNVIEALCFVNLWLENDPPLLGVIEKFSQHDAFC